MTNLNRFAAILAVLMITAAPLAFADDGAPSCEEAIAAAQRLLQDLDWDEADFGVLSEALDPVAEACPQWGTVSPGVDMAAAATTQAANQGASALATLCAGGSMKATNVPIVVTFKVGGNVQQTFRDIGQAEVYQDPSTKETMYKAEGYFFGLDASSNGEGWITVRDARVIAGHATVTPYCTAEGRGTCGGHATIESNTDRLSVTGSSGFVNCPSGL